MIRNVVEYLQYTEKKYPNKVALVDEYHKYTYSEVNQKAKKIATQIHTMIGDKLNLPIAVYMEKSIDCIVAFLGVLYSGNFYSPIDVSMPIERVRRIVDVLKPVAVIYKGELPEETPIADVRISIDKIDDININEICCRKYLEVLDIDPIYTLFTSGSTGTPKGVVISHKGVIDYTEWLAETFNFDDDTVFGNQAPFYFDNSILDIYSTIRNGATLVILPENLFKNPEKMIEFMNMYHVNTIFWVPSALMEFANSGVLDKYPLKYLEKVLFCGEVMPNKQLNVWRNNYPGLLYVNMYGPTEITDVCTYYIVDRKFDDNEPLPIGKACKNMDVLVLNDQGKCADINETGELCVRGTGLSMGYYGDQERTKEVFVQNPTNNKYIEYIYKTGDIVKINEKQEIIYIGRKDFQIKYMGHRIELGEIETVINSIGEIESACCAYDEKKELILCIYKGNIDKKTIRNTIRNCLPRYMMPHKYIQLEEMPLNANGKIDRAKLKNSIIEGNGK